MKTTIEIPDDLFREAAVAAARQGRPLEELVIEALREKTGATPGTSWRRAHGALHHLRAESRRVRKWIEEEFERVGPSA